MDKLSFSTKPQKKYYSYLPDGHIYKITTTIPTVIADGGGYWSCYFECQPYHMDTTAKKTYLLYEGITSEGTTKYVPTTASSYNSGRSYYYFEDDDTKKETPKAHSGNYYTKNGDTQYSMPKSATELPQTTYDGKTYYFDTLIEEGASYSTKDKKFIPMDVTPGTSATTYGDILLEMVNNSVNINSFIDSVNSIPEYLTGPDLTKEYEITSINYKVPAKYLILYGTLFIEKLNQTMKEKGDKIVKNYLSKVTSTDTYSNVTITTNIATATNIGTVTNTPVSNT